MEVGNRRIRLIFRDDDILSDSQKFEGFSHSWVLLKPHQHDAVSDLAYHILHTFQLHQSCPHGLFLSISGFVLPPFESTHILKDNEIISVRKRKDVLSIEGNGAANDVRKFKALGKQPVNSGVLLLTCEEFEKEKGGYENEEPEYGDEDLLEVVENSSGVNVNKRNPKRKDADRPQGYKKKKKQHVEAKNGGNSSSYVCKEKRDGFVDGDNVENSDKPAKDSDGNNASGNGVKRTVDVQEKGRETDDTKVSPVERKKIPSRSARRKKAKRIWLREMAKIRKQNATCESEGLRNWKEDQAKADRKRSDDQWKGQQKWKNNHADVERNEVNGQPKGVLQWKLSSQNSWHVKGKSHKLCSQNEQVVQQDHTPLETFNWNGITSKKEGQQWGEANHGFTTRNNYNTNKEDSETPTKEKEMHPNVGIDFDKLPPLPGIPKKGDLIAYRVLELSSTWTPELSAHRVGRVSWYNTRSNRTMLRPVPEYPIVPERDDGDEATQPDKSLYKADGSLEISFHSLIDVRIVTNVRSEPVNEAAKHMSEASTGNLNAFGTALPNSSDKPIAEPSSEEISGSIWDQLSESLNAKKEQLVENGWGSTPKKVYVLKKPQASSPGTNWGKKAQKPEPSKLWEAEHRQ